MRTCCQFLVLVCLGVLFPPFATAQDVFNEYVTQPDIWRPANVSAPGVDAKGDLNLSIPVLTVPGRNGLDFNITFSYASSIKATQQSSWVGLGWSFDPGSITRDVQSVYADGQAHTVDYAEVPVYQPDMYYVSIPGGGFSMIRLPAAQGATTMFRPAGAGDGHFVATQWKPWKIEPDPAPAVVTEGGFSTALYYEGPLPNDTQSNDKLDFENFLLTDVSGTRYLFAAPTLASHTTIGPGDHGTVYNTEHYVSTWRLVAILGIDYVGDPRVAPADDAAGSWVRFDYGAVRSRQRSYSQHGTELHQARYLTAIVTPTHKAVFQLGSSRCEVDCDNWGTRADADIYSQLSAISLHTQPDPTGVTYTVKTVELGYSTPGHPPADQLGVERLKLEHIQYKGSGSSTEVLPGYSFAYHTVSDLGLIGPFFGGREDDFGYFNAMPVVAGPGSHINLNTMDGTVLSLKEIVYPTGGWITIEYENDWIHVDGTPYEVGYQTKAGLTGSASEASYSIDGSNNRQGGARVTRMVQYSGVPNDIFETVYTYGPGRLSGVPGRYWARSLSNPAQPPGLFIPNSRGKASVYYTSVRRDKSDGTFSVTEYTTDVNNDVNVGSVNPLQAVVFSRGNSRLLIQDNAEMNWGIPFRSTSGGPGGTTQTTTVHNLSRAPLAEVFGIIPTYVWWRFANLVEKESTNQNGVYTERVFDYDNQKGLLKRTEVYTPGEPTLVTRRRYAYEEAYYSALTEANILTAVIQEDVSERSATVVPPPLQQSPTSGCNIHPVVGGEPDDVLMTCPNDNAGSGADSTPNTSSYTEDVTDLVFHSASTSTWAPFITEEVRDELIVAVTVPTVVTVYWKPHQTYQWTASSPGLLPNFSFTNPDGSDDAWVLLQTLSRYDLHGRVLEQVDAKGTKTLVYYGDPLQEGTPVAISAARCENTPPSDINAASIPFRSSYLTCVEVTDASGQLSQQREIRYDNLGRMVEVLDRMNDVNQPVNSEKISFTYDAFGRLKETFANDELLNTYVYTSAREGTITGKASVNHLNKLSVTARTGTYYNDPAWGEIEYQTTSFIDGLGVGVQEHTRKRSVQPDDVNYGGISYIVTGQAFDRVARKQKTYKPIDITNLTPAQIGTYILDIETRTAGAYGTSSTSRAYTEVENDGLGRPVAVVPPSLEAGTGVHQEMSYSNPYKVGAMGAPGEGRGQAILVTDEDGNQSQTFTDARGRDYATHNYILLPAHDVSIPQAPLPLILSVTGTGGAAGSIIWGTATSYTTPAMAQTQWVYLTQSPRHTGAECRVRLYDATASPHHILQDTEGEGCTALDAFIAVQGRQYRLEFMAGIASGSTATVEVEYTVAFEQAGVVRVANETHFDYDAVGNLTSVINPTGYATEYQYNTLGQLVAKTTPDADAHGVLGNPADESLSTPDFRYAYDVMGNLRFSQDAQQQRDNMVAFTSYDAFNRPTVSGVGPFVANTTFADLTPQGRPAAHERNTTTEADAYVHTANFYDTKPNVLDFPWNSFAAVWGHVPALNHTHGRLTAVAYKAKIAESPLSLHFQVPATSLNTGQDLQQAAHHLTADNPISISADAICFFEAGQSIRIGPGFQASNFTPIGEFRARIDPSLQQAAGAEWVVALYSYDNQGRVEAVHQYLGAMIGLKSIYYDYDLQGNVIAVRFQPDVPSESFFTWYDYDSLGQLVQVTTHTINQPNDVDAVVEACYAYRDNGQVKKATLAANSSCEQYHIPTFTYSYHIRDWLTGINTVTPSATNPATPFAMQLYYDTVGGTGATPRHNGNIAAIEWMTKGGNGKHAFAPGRYTFDYDGLQRLTAGTFAHYNTNTSLWENPSGAFDLRSVSYDQSGNIESLDRRDDTGSGSAWAYSYVAGSNRLDQVLAGTQRQREYGYDANGNVTTTNANPQTANFAAKQWQEGITYDHRNLPLDMTVKQTSSGAQSTLNFRYDGAGQRIYKKLTKPCSSGSCIETLYYIRGVDGQVLAVYDENQGLRYWNIISGSQPIGRAEPASLD